MSTVNLQFKIQGEYITNLAREKAHVNHDIPYAINLLMDCLETDQVSKNQRLLWCLQILNNKAHIKGTYPDADYGLMIDEESKTDIQSELCILLQPMMTVIQNSQESYQNLLQKYEFLLDYLNMPDYRLREIDKEYHQIYDEHIFNIQSDNMPPILQEYIDRQISHTTDDYGWLEPNGTFHPVEWGQHEEWAVDYLDKHYPFKNNEHLYCIPDDTNTQKHIVGGDCLVYKLHWILLHNPSQGIAKPQYDTIFGMTKAQKEFLYDYYIKRNKHNMANELYEKD